MTLYFVVFALLWFGFALRAASVRTLETVDVIALLIFVLVAGQRFETGNDWVIYRDHFSAMQDYMIWGSERLADFPDFEPLYVLTVWVVGIFFDFQTFLLLVAVFNGIVLFRFSRFWKASFVGVCAIYYAWLYLGTQMATIRYSLAMSFLMLATMCVVANRRWAAAVFCLIAVGYHLSVLAFVPLFVLFGRRITLAWAAIVLAVGYALVQALLSLVLSGMLAGVPFLDKLSLYLQVATISQLSWASWGYLALNIAFFIWIFVSDKDDAQWRVVQWSVFYLLFLEIVLWSIPIFWVRAQVFVIVIQAGVLARAIVTRRSMVSVLALACVSLAVFYRTIADPAFISYVPYQSYWVNVLFLGDAAHDGEARFYEAIERSKERSR